MTIFIDASVAVSYFDINDSNHVKSLTIAQQFGKNKIITSDYVFSEIVTIVSQNADKETAISTGEYLQDYFSIIKSSVEIDKLAWEIFKKQKSKNVSFVDCTIFALYQQGLFDKVFTFDKDFKKNKIPVLE